VSAEYAAKGYTLEYQETCEYRLYGISAHHAAGDRAMRKFSRIFKKNFNKVIRKLDKGEYDNDTGARSLQVENDEPSILVTHIEVAFQQPRSGSDGMADGAVGRMADTATRKLSSLSESSSGGGAAIDQERNLQWTGPYGYAKVIRNMTCRMCNGGDQFDDRRRGRQLKKDTLAQADFTEMVFKDLKQSGMAYFTSPEVMEANCFEISCNGGLWTGTEGCI